MKNEGDWKQRDYVVGRAKEYCRNIDCDWEIRRDNIAGLDDSGRCPVCGEVTNSMITFGGLIVIYNRVTENFTLKSPYNEREIAYVDNADCPDAILFMLRHFPFERWWEPRRRREGDA